MLSVRSLVKVYPGNVCALQGIDLDVPGGMFGLLGPNGAGKTTFMRIVAGLLEPTSGSVTLDGLDVVRQPEAVRARLGYLPQEFGFYPHLTGAEMLEHLLRLKGVDAPAGLRRLTRELLERVNLAFAAKRKVKGYSGGMRQRLGIAQALAGDPRLVIVDEPTAGLDPEERLRFYRLLAELAASRIVLLSTHIVEDVSVLCPRFGVIRAGRLVAQTSPSAARAALAGAIFEGELGEAELAELRRSRCVTQAILYEGRNRVRLYLPDGDAPDGFASAEPTLEDAYFVLMQSAPAVALPAAAGTSAEARLDDRARRARAQPAAAALLDLGRDPGAHRLGHVDRQDADLDRRQLCRRHEGLGDLRVRAVVPARDRRPGLLRLLRVDRGGDGDPARRGIARGRAPARDAADGREYVWGKFLGLVLSFAAVGALHVAASVFFNHALVTGADAEIVGPLELGNYLWPVLWFALPGILFLAGAALAAGTLGRRPIVIYFLPVAVLLFTSSFLWTWKPHWLGLGWDRVLMALDPAGVRWLQRTWLDVDRGVGFYNAAPVGLDALFVSTRLAFVALGLAAVALTERRLARTLRGAHPVRRRALEAVATGTGERATTLGLAGLGMRSGRSGFLAQAACVTRVELRELRSSPGLYLFVPLIVLDVIEDGLYRLGAFDTPVLWTSGLLALACFNSLTLLVCLLLLFYTVESLERERAAGLAPILGAAPLASGAILLGKTLANAVLGAAILLAAFLASALVLLVQGEAPLELAPFALLWGVLLVPTFLFWNALVACTWALVKNRYTTYALGLGVLMLSGWLQLTGRMNWVGNWNLWNAVRWSDLAPLELDRTAYVLNRVLVLGAAGLLVALALRFLERREPDPIGRASRRRPGPLLRAAMGLAPFALVPLAAGIWLAVLVRDGYGGGLVKKEEKDYWSANVRTWVDAPQPAIAAAEVELELDPARSFLRSKGTLTLVNDGSQPLPRFAVTAGTHWEDTRLVLENATFSWESEEKSHLRVFRLEQPLAPGAKVPLSFSFEGTLPGGISKNGPHASEFVLPGGVKLTSFTPSFVPVVGFLEGVGVEKENRYEPKDYPDDFYLGVTPSTFGVDVPYPVKVTVRGPAEYTYNSVGVKTGDAVADGVRTVTWETDRPVLFFNVLAGRWVESRGEGTAIHHSPEHAFNVPAMSAALADARRWYGEWFSPSPLARAQALRVPGLRRPRRGLPHEHHLLRDDRVPHLRARRRRRALPRDRARGRAPVVGKPPRAGQGPGRRHPLRGRLALRDDPPVRAGEGPRATHRLLQGARNALRRAAPGGFRARAREDRRLARGRHHRHLRQGRGVFWMLLNHLGRERGLAGYRSFLEHYEGNPDHPVLQDFVAHMRELAPDPAEYDAFTRQWFFQVVVPEYELRDARKETLAGGKWRVTATVKNEGTGTMPVEVAAARGTRFPEREAEGAAGNAVLAADRPASAPGAPSPDYRDARTTIVLGPGEEHTLEILCPFEPEYLVVDPDALVLQLERKKARAEL